MRKILGLGAALLAVTTIVVIGLTGGSAGACSLIAHTLSATQPPEVGAPITVNGSGFFTVEGDLAADCTGATFTADEGVLIVATYTTPDGQVTETKAATVLDGDSYELEPLVFTPPAGATSVTFTATSANDPTYSVTPFELPLAEPLTNEPPTTVPPTTVVVAEPPAVPTAAPADPVRGAADFTG